MTVDWSTEWLNSLIWIVGVTVLAVLGAAIVLALVTYLPELSLWLPRLVLK